MKRLILVALFIPVLSFASPRKEMQRPPILGVAYVKVWASNVDEATHFYAAVLRSMRTPSMPCDWCESTPPIGGSFALGGIELDKGQPASSTDHLKEIAFTTGDVKKLSQFLKEKRFAPDRPRKCGIDSCLHIQDPEGHLLIFIQRSNRTFSGMTGAYSSLYRLPTAHPVFVVHDRALMDHFYKEVLGFHVYSAMEKENAETGRVEMQVPDGTDWIEYKLPTPSDTEAGAPRTKTHILFTVANIGTVADHLRDDHLMSILDEPKSDLDGRIHINLFDPDGMSVELIESALALNPVTSQFVSSQPKP
jgi:catechol 2,3-dioxygenase-like lactoylglutathione lyase family enzyme